MSFPTFIRGDEGDQFKTTDTDGATPIGTRMGFANGDEYRWVNVAGTILAVARLNQGALIASPFGVDENATVAAAAAAVQVTVDAASAPSLDDLKVGVLIDETTSHSYEIEGNADADPTVIDLHSPAGLITDIATGDTLRYYKSPYKDVIITPAAGVLGVICGFTVHIVAADSWGWVKCRGFTPVLVDGTLAIGDVAHASVDDAGAVGTEAAVDQPAGVTYNIGTDTNADGEIYATLS